jgi:GTP1/Obg family GTP-binding protein
MQQLNLLKEVQRMFPLTPILVALNKIDITPEEQLRVARERLPNAYEIVAVNQTGVESLLQDALEEIDLKPMQEKIDEYLESLSRE